jgi:hypothetical protein
MDAADLRQATAGQGRGRRRPAVLDRHAVVAQDLAEAPAPYQTVGKVVGRQAEHYIV